MTMDTDILYEAMVRALAAGCYLSTAIVIFRVRSTAVRTIGALCYVSKAAHVIAQFPPAMAPLGKAYLLFDIPSVAGAALAWLFVTEFFGEPARFDRRKLVPVVIVVANGLVASFAPPKVGQLLWLLHNFITVGLMSHVLVVVANGWSGDLVQRRRLVATPLFAIAALYSIAVAFVQTVEAFSLRARHPSWIAADVLLFSSLLGLVVFGQSDSTLFASDPKEVRPRTTKGPSAVLLASADNKVATELNRLMQDERLYRMQNLRISTLALKLQIPEHRLRVLLNHHLGFRNFSAFVAQWRLAEAKEALNDPEQFSVPISTIAIDSGFQSLAPFNRAFKNDTGMTPSEFRARAIEGERQRTARLATAAG